MTPLDSAGQESETTTLNPQSARAGATIVDLSKNSDDSRPAIRAVIARLYEAMNAGLRVIIQIGEAHTNISHVRFAEELRAAIAKDKNLSAYFDKTVIAQENDYNSFEFYVPELFSELKYSFNAVAYYALRETNPVAYHELNALTSAACNWPQAPVARLENTITWIENKQDIRMVDMALAPNKKDIDLYDLKTRAWLQRLDPQIKKEIKAVGEKINSRGPLGMWLRNLWMAEQIKKIDAKLILLQTGRIHLGGSEGDPYAQSLHSILQSSGIRVVTIYPEYNNLTFKNSVPPNGQAAMDNPDTIIIQGGCEDYHDTRDKMCSFEQEIETLNRRAKAQRTSAPKIQTRAQYDALLQEFQNQLPAKALELGVMSEIEPAPAPVP